MTKKTEIPSLKRKRKKRSKIQKNVPAALSDVPDVELAEFISQHDEEMIVTPKDAKQMTNKMYWNMRGVTKSRVVNYAKMMEQGFWMPGMTISMAVLEGKHYLIDGQHRLLALIEYGQPIRFNIKYYECSDKDQVEHLYQIFDQGKTKTRVDTMISAGAGEQLELSKKKLSRATSAVGKIYRKFGRSPYGMEGESWQFCNNPLMQSKILSEGWGDAIRGYYEAIQGAMKEMTRPGGNLNRSICVAIGLLMFRADPEKAFRFWKGVGNFYRLEEDDPRFTAGRYVMSTPMTRDSDIPNYRHVRALIYCWNAWAQHRTLQRIAVCDDRDVKVFGFDYEI